jgi:hypothetical protein
MFTWVRSVAVGLQQGAKDGIQLTMGFEVPYTAVNTIQYTKLSA